MMDEIQQQLFEIRVEWLVYLLLRKNCSAGDMQEAVAGAAMQTSAAHCDESLLAYARTFVNKLKEGK
jgi:hypothetical protein